MDKKYNEQRNGKKGFNVCYDATYSNTEEERNYILTKRIGFKILKLHLNDSVSLTCTFGNHVKWFDRKFTEGRILSRTNVYDKRNSCELQTIRLPTLFLE